MNWKLSASSALAALLGVALAAVPAPVVADPADAPGSVEMIDAELARSVIDEVVPDVERLRGLEFKRPVAVEVVDDEQVRRHLMERLERFGLLEEIDPLSRTLVLLGLADAGTDLLALYTEALREQVGGFYDPDTQTYYLLDDMPAGLATMLTAHELTHALEDQYYALDSALAELIDDDDRLFARSALHEGSATVLMTVYMTEQAFAGKLDGSAMDAAELSSDALERMPPVLMREMLAPYVLGAAFVLGGDMMAVAGKGYPSADVDRLFEHPPQSSEQILHPEKYWEEEHRDDPRPVRLGEAGATLGRGWTRSIGGVLGEITVALLTGAETPSPDDVRSSQGERWTNAAATGWGGDRWELWEKGDQAVVLLSTVWDSAADAAEFAAALEESGLKHATDDDRVAVVAGKLSLKKTSRVLEAMLDAIVEVP